MEIKKFTFNPFPVNTYVVWDKETKEGVIIDAGCYYADEQEALEEYIRQNRIEIKHLLVTHLHLDHNFGNAYVARTFAVQPEAAQSDEFLLEMMEGQAAMFGMKLPDKPIPVGHYLQEGDEIKIGHSVLRAIAVPGHSPGSLVFYAPDADAAFVGDVLFRESIGRTDLPGGNYAQLISGIREKLLTLPEHTILYSGHGPESSIGYEKRNNPYLR